MNYGYECWKCDEWHALEINTRHELKALKKWAKIKPAKLPRRKFRTGRSEERRKFLIPLPFGLGMVIGGGFYARTLIRSWEWARYDYADLDPKNSPRWNYQVLTRTPNAPAGIVARWVEGYRV